MQQQQKQLPEEDLPFQIKVRDKGIKVAPTPSLLLVVSTCEAPIDEGEKPRNSPLR